MEYTQTNNTPEYGPPWRLTPEILALGDWYRKTATTSKQSGLQVLKPVLQKTRQSLGKLEQDGKESPGPSSYKVTSSRDSLNENRAHLQSW